MNQAPRGLTIAANGTKLLLGVLFILSALAKFVAVEKLNIYIFSFGFFSLNLSVIVGWLAISFELALGAAYLTGHRHRWTSLAAFLMIVGFTLFLGYAALSGRTDSCHCMGELLPFNPVQSMLKNAFLLAIILFSRRFADEEFHPRWWLTLPLSIVPLLIILASALWGSLHVTYIDFQYTATLTLCMAVVAVIASFRFSHRLWVELLFILTPLLAVFVLSTAANFMNLDHRQPLNNDLLQSTIAPSGALGQSQVSEGRKVVCLYSRTCPYCMIASQKISYIQSRNNLPEADFITIFPGDSATDLSSFYAETNATRYAELKIDPDTFLYLTYGQFPLIMLIDNGNVVKTYGHGDIAEREIVRFLKNEKQ